MQRVVVVWLGGGLGRPAEHVVEEADGVTLEAESDVRVHRRGNADVGVPTVP